MELLRSLGADKVIDYTQQDLTQGGETYDLILHVLGKGSLSRCQGSPLRRSGKKGSIAIAVQPAAPSDLQSANQRG